MTAEFPDHDTIPSAMPFAEHSQPSEREFSLFETTEVDQLKQAIVVLRAREVEHLETIRRLEDDLANVRARSG